MMEKLLLKSIILYDRSILHLHQPQASLVNVIVSYLNLMMVVLLEMEQKLKQVLKLGLMEQQLKFMVMN
jgi:hypothetical protein